MSHRGAVYPSGFLPRSVGSVHETPLPELDREAQLMRALRDADRLTEPCGRPDRTPCTAVVTDACIAVTDAHTTETAAPTTTAGTAV